MKSRIKILLAVLALILISMTSTACGSNDRYSMDGKDWGANFDWGDHHYWDTNKHSVQEKPW